MRSDERVRLPPSPTAASHTTHHTGRTHNHIHTRMHTKTTKRQQRHTHSLSLTHTRNQQPPTGEEKHHRNTARTLDLVGAVPLLLLVEEEGAHLGQLRPPDFHLVFCCFLVGWLVGLWVVVVVVVVVLNFWVGLVGCVS